MKTVEFTYGGKSLHLYMNGAAMFAIDGLDSDRPADYPDAIDRLKENTPEGVADLLNVALILAEQGELCRRYLHYSPERIPDAKELLLLLSPAQLSILRVSVMLAINAGYTQKESGENDDIDTGLAELEKKRDFDQGTLSSDGVNRQCPSQGRAFTAFSG